MHECCNCGQACDCDGEDTWLDQPRDCECECNKELPDDPDWLEGNDWFDNDDERR